MPIVEVITRINAPAEICFDLARDINLHIASTEGMHEKAISGRHERADRLGEEVTWEATRFGMRRRLTSRIIEL